MEAKRIPFTIDNYNKLVVEAETHIVKTQSNAVVTIFTVAANGSQPIVGQLKHETEIRRWNPGGKFFASEVEAASDLFIEKLPPKSLGWINVYQCFEGTPTREEADSYAAIAEEKGHKRLACIEVFEGKGLDDTTTDSLCLNSKQQQ